MNSRNKSGQFRKKTSLLQIFTFIVSLLTLVIVVYCTYEFYIARQEYSKDRQSIIRYFEKTSNTHMSCVYETIEGRYNDRIVYECPLPDVSDTGVNR